MNIGTHFDYNHCMSTRAKMAPDMEKVSITAQMEHEIADSAFQK